jgi:hypothetical protein
MDPLRMRTLTRLLPPPDTVLGTEAGWTQWPIWTIDRARSFWCNASVNTQCQINFKFNVSPAELAEAFAPLAEPIAKVPGLRWKIWSLNEATSEFGGIYLFDDADSVQAFLEGPIVAEVGKHPAVSDINVKQFGVIDEFSAITRGPV